MGRITGPVLALALLLAAPLATHAAEPAAGGPDYAEPGPYRVDVREIEVPRPGTTERFDARLFMPTPDDGDADIEASPIYAFGHGYLAPIEPYQSTLEHLASWGVTVVAPRSGSGLVPSHQAFAADLVAALDEVTARSAADDWSGLPVDASARGVGGHSMGGGAAVLAAAQDPNIRAVATLTAADTRPSAVEAATRVQAPMLLVAGSEDRITPVDEHQRPIYEAAAGPAQLRILVGGGHCGYLDQADLIGLVCGQDSLSTEEQRTEGRAALTAWLRALLMDDPAAAERMASGSRFVTVETKGVDEA